jgi:hypothetical protein
MEEKKLDKYFIRMSNLGERAKKRCRTLGEWDRDRKNNGLRLFKRKVFGGFKPNSRTLTLEEMAKFLHNTNFALSLEEANEIIPEILGGSANYARYGADGEIKFFTIATPDKETRYVVQNYVPSEMWE